MNAVLISLISLLVSFNSHAANLCHTNDISASADNNVFIEFWTARLKILNDGIPELSPRESAWLDSELKAGGADIRASQRWVNAMRSKEHRLRRVKQWSNSMAAITRHWKDTPRHWIILAHYFLDSATTSDIVALVNSGVIKKEIIPEEWTVLGLEEGWIDQRRMYYAKLIIGCNLPNSLRMDLSKPL